MKKFIIFTFLAFLTLFNYAFASDLQTIQAIQTRIDNCGAKILNANRIAHPVIFAYDDKDGALMKKIKSNTALTSRQIIVYGSMYQFIQNDDELAAFLSRGIVLAVRSYDGAFSGWLRSLQIKAAPKKYEIVADKMAVDYMVKAGYDPVALITFIQKTSPQKRYDTISTRNLTSKRLAIIYEYIYTKYPYYLLHNKYLHDDNYQNFLLNSKENRKLFEQKIRTKSTERLKYE